MMIYETIFDGKQIPRIGFGTWKIGGDSRADPKLDSISLAALRTALEVGYTHVDTAGVYADGHSEELTGQAVRETGLKRDSLFMTTKDNPEHLKYEQVLKACERLLQRLRMDHIDFFLIHWPGIGVAGCQPRVITIPLSLNPQHIKENFQSANIRLRQEGFKTLSELW